MHLIEVDAESAEDALVEAARHIPAAVPLGKPSVAMRDVFGGGVEFATSVGFFWVRQDHAERLVPTDDGPELTTWRHGECVGVVLSTRPE